MTEKKTPREDADDETPKITLDESDMPNKEGKPPNPVGPLVTGVILVDSQRNNPTPAEIPASSMGHTIYVNGQTYEHVATGDGGVWIFAPSR